MTPALFEYFKKEVDEAKILVRVNSKTLEGVELIITKDGYIKKTERSFDESIYEDLEADDFTTGNTIEFNLYLQGVIKNK